MGGVQYTDSTGIRVVCNGQQGEKGEKGDTETASIDPDVVQMRVNGSCSQGQFITSIAKDGTVTCGTLHPVSDGFAQLTAISSPGSERTILSNDPLNLRVSCEQAGSVTTARLRITPNGAPVNVMFDKNGSDPEFFSATNEESRVITSGQGGGKFFVQLVGQISGKVFTVQGWAFNFTSGGGQPVCQVVWTTISTAQ